jgi:putative ABC transport system permease protein
MRRRITNIARLFFGRRQMEAELDDEVRSYLEMLTERNISQGLAPSEARRQALLELGGVEQVKESVRDVRMGAALDSVVADLRQAWRMLRKNPGFATIAVLTLALGIGANTAIFTVVHAVLLGSLPYDHSGQLAIVWSSFQKMGASRAPASGVELREIRNRSRMFSDAAGIWVGNGTFTGEGDPEQVKTAFVTTNFFTVLGAHPAIGRSFVTEERAGGRAAVILSNGLWRRRFGGDPAISGRTVRFEGGDYTVAGVMPPGFQLFFPPDANVPLDVQAWIPFPYDIYASPRDLYFIRILARLKPGVTMAQAQTDVNGIAKSLRERFTEYAAENLKLEVSELHKDAVQNVRPALLALFAGAGLVLLISCVNVANLLLARSNARRKEIALRVSLGASAARIIRQLLAESLVLCCLGGVLGLLVGWWGVHLLLSIKPDSLARLGSAELNLPVLGFVTLISLASAILFGLAPALTSARFNLVETLREAGRTSTAYGSRRFRSALVTVEIALSFVLLTGAGLMIRSCVELQRVNPGFRPSRVLTFEISMPWVRYDRDVDRENFVTRWGERLSALAGVESAGAISHLPLDDYPNWYSPYAPEGFTEQQTRNLLADHRAVTPGYFEAMGARLIAGRWFNQMDTASSHPVVIVDELLARTTWPGQNPLGKKMKAEHYVNGSFVSSPAEIVGVVAHIRHHGLAKELRGQIYIPYPQSPREHLSYVVKAKGDPLALAGAIRRELKQMDKDLALNKVRPMADYVARATAPASFTALLAGIFGALALVLAAIGIYGVVSYSVSQRTHEMGVRMALGARPTDVLRLVIQEGLVLTGLGVLVGAAGSLALARSLETLLFGVTAFDPVTYLASACVIPAAALVACWRPAHHAASGNPVDAIRAE